MMFTTGIILAIAGFFIGHMFGDAHLHTYNRFDYIACTMFVGGAGLVFASIFTITWRYMP